MADNLDVKILGDGPRNAVVKMVGTLDSADLSEVPAVALSEFSDYGGRSLAGLRVDEIQYSITPGLNVVLAWNGSDPQPIATLAGSDKLDFRKVGGLCPDTSAVGFEGGITVTTTGFSPGTPAGFTLELRMVKKY